MYDETHPSPSGIPLGWEWQVPYDDPFEQLVDDAGSVVATIDWTSSPPAYAVGGATHLFAGEDWQPQSGGNVVVADVGDIKAAIARELKAIQPRERLADVLGGAQAASQSLGNTPEQPHHQRRAPHTERR